MANIERSSRHACGLIELCMIFSRLHVGQISVIDSKLTIKIFFPNFEKRVIITNKIAYNNFSILDNPNILKLL